MSECSRYDRTMDYDDWLNLRPDKRLCRCPNCKGFLPQSIPEDKPFKCKRCGIELLVMPDHDEDTDEEVEWGRICPVSKPQSSSRIKEKAIDIQGENVKEEAEG